MAQRERTLETAHELREREEWVDGTAAGIVAGLAMGVFLSALTPETLERSIPSLVGLTGGVAGWVVHVSVAAVFGVGFATVIVWRPETVRGGTFGQVVAVAVAYAVVVWFVAFGLVMPAWLGLLDGAGVAMPNLTAMGLVAHVVYGLVLGATYDFLR